jgi:K+-transporting ATPase KdpF subunit
VSPFDLVVALVALALGIYLLFALLRAEEL